LRSPLPYLPNWRVGGAVVLSGLLRNQENLVLSVTALKASFFGGLCEMGVVGAGSSSIRS